MLMQLRQAVRQACENSSITDIKETFERIIWYGEGIKKVICLIWIVFKKYTVT